MHARISGSYCVDAGSSVALVLESLRNGHREYSAWRAGAASHSAWPAHFQESQARSVPLVFAGVIRNRNELAAAINAVTTQDDTHLLWQLFLHYGVEGFELVNGTFAIALFDAAEQRLVLATDRWGCQPLHFSRQGHRWRFASEQKALLGDPFIERSCDVETAVQLTRTKYLPLHRTLLTEVICLGPAEYACIDKEGMHLGTYNRVRQPVRAHIVEEECATELHQHLLNATSRLLEGHARIGVALSSGLDSVLTLGAIRAVAPDIPIYTYTASFQRDDPVLAKAAAAAEHFHTEHREIVIEPEELPSALSEAVWRMEDPVAREEMLVYYRVTQRAAEEVSTILYGHMADMLFAGMPRHRLISMAARAPCGRSALMEFYDYTQTGAPPHSAAGHMLIGLYFRGRRAQPLRTLQRCSSMGGKQLELTREQPLNNALLSALAQPSELPGIQRLHTAAGLSMGSIFHDREVARYAFQIPDHLKIRGRHYKHILRVAAAQLVPAAFAQRPKDLIRIGLSERVRRVMQHMAHELLTPEVVRARGIFAADDVSSLVRRIADPACAQGDLYNLWTLLLLEIWTRTFLDPAFPAPYSVRASELDAASMYARPAVGVAHTSALQGSNVRLI